MTSAVDGSHDILSQFGLREHPFAPTADPAYFYAAPEHKECLFRLWNSIDNRHGIAVVLGSYGTGKTTLLRKLIVGMAADPERYNTAVIGSPIPSWTTFALLESINAQFKLRAPERSFVSYVETLNRFLLQNRSRISTLIIDDAQNLNKRGQLELLRLVQNLETQQHKLLNLVFFAQMEWTEVLRAAPNFEQRINMTYTLPGLGIDETRRFIDFRLARAGAGGALGIAFTDEAVEAIHRYAEGNPRVMVTLCRNAMVVAGRLRTRRITQDVVLHTIDKTTLPNSDKRINVTSTVSTREREVRPPTLANLPMTGRKSNDDRASQMLLRAARNREATN